MPESTGSDLFWVNYIDLTRPSPIWWFMWGMAPPIILFQAGAQTFWFFGKGAKWPLGNWGELQSCSLAPCGKTPQKPLNMGNHQSNNKFGAITSFRW